jgi:hypothetical protein
LLKALVEVMITRVVVVVVTAALAEHWQVASPLGTRVH